MPRPGVTTDDALDSWRATPSGKPGGQRTYADIAIEAALTIRIEGEEPERPRRFGASVKAAGY